MTLLSMPSRLRQQKELLLSVDGSEYFAVAREIPFREGLELSCWIDGQELRVSDRGLGEHEAIRLLEEEIRSYLTQEFGRDKEDR